MVGIKRIRVKQRRIKQCVCGGVSSVSQAAMVHSSRSPQILTSGGIKWQALKALVRPSRPREVDTKGPRRLDWQLLPCFLSLKTALQVSIRETAGLGNRRSRRSSRTAWAALRLRRERRGQGRQQRRKREGRKEEGRSIDTNLGPRLTETAGAGAGAGTHISLRPFTENSP